VADTRLTAEALVEEVGRRAHQATGMRTPELAERIASFDPLGDFTATVREGQIDPRTLMVELDRILPDDRCLVVDPGHHISFSVRYLHVPSPDRLVMPSETGSIGLGIGA